MADESRSRFQTIDILSRIFLGLIAVLIPFIVNHQAQKFNERKQRADLIRSVIEDISKHTVREDIALAFLNSSSAFCDWFVIISHMKFRFVKTNSFAGGLALRFSFKNSIVFMITFLDSSVLVKRSKP